MGIKVFVAKNKGNLFTISKNNTNSGKHAHATTWNLEDITLSKTIQIKQTTTV